MSNTNDFPPVAYGYTKLTELKTELETLMPGGQLHEDSMGYGVRLAFHAHTYVDDHVYPSREDALKGLRVLVEVFQNEVLYKTGAQVKVDAWRQELRESQRKVRELEATLRTRNDKIVHLQEEIALLTGADE